MAKEIKLTIRIPDWRDLKTFFTSIFKNPNSIAFLRAVLDKKYYWLFFVLLFILLAWQLGLISAMLWIVFLVYLLYQLDLRQLVAVALILIAACPFFLIAQKGAWSEQAAIYAYILLIMAVVLQIVEYISPVERTAKKNNQIQK